jgi:acetate kinase
MPNQTVRRILTINTGSSSLKVALYEAGREEARILSGEVGRIGVPGDQFCLTDVRGATLIDQEVRHVRHRVPASQRLNRHPYGSLDRRHAYDRS